MTNRQKVFTLEEAIEHAIEIGKDECNECGEQHKQLAQWLQELKKYREEVK